MKDTWSKPDYNLLPELKSLKIATLVVYSDHDFIPASTAERIHASNSKRTNGYVEKLRTFRLLRMPRRSSRTN